MRRLAIAALIAIVAPAPARADLELHGRVFARETLAKAATADATAAPWLLSASVASARLSVEFRHARTVKTALEVEFSDGDAAIKDAYVRWRPVRAFTLQAGRFKPPISAVSLEGLWSLPAVERGLLNDLEFAGVSLPLGGRSDGIRLAFEPRTLPMSVEVAAFQPRVAAVVDASEHAAVDVYARATWLVAEDVTWGTTFGLAGYYDKPEKALRFRHAPVGAMDVMVDARRWQLWADVAVGIDALPFAFDVATIDLPCDLEQDQSSCPPVERIADRGVFVAARAIASVRLRPSRWVRTVEPFVSASFVDLNVRYTADEAKQLGGGVASRLERRLRAQLHVDRTTGKSDAPVADATRVFLQLGTAF